MITGCLSARWGSWILAGALLAGLGSSPSWSQDDAPPEADPLNHAYAVYLGSGLYVAGGRSVFVVRIAPRIKVRSEEEHSFGIRLRINATFGFYDLKPEDFLDAEIPDELGTFALVPGVEFPIKLFDNWTLAPFLDVGPATDTAFREITLVVGTGLRSRAELHDKRHTFLLWNDFIYARNSRTDVSQTDDYTLFRTDFELRGLVKYSLGQRPMDLGLLFRSEFFFDTVIVELPLGRPVGINHRWDIGLTTGSTEPWQFFKRMITAPRFGVAYRFGEGTSSVVFSIRFRN